MNSKVLHGYGLCCRMPGSNPDDETTSSSNVVNPPDAGRQGPLTRQQSTIDAVAQAAAAAAAAATAQAAAPNPAPAASQGAQSVTATIDYHSLATAMSRLDDSASNLEKGTQPK